MIHRPRITAILMATVLILIAVLGLMGMMFRGPAVFSVPDGFQPRQVSSDQLEQTVRLLCTDLSPRFYKAPGNLSAVADWLAWQLAETGLTVEEQSYSIRDDVFRNIIGSRIGTDPDAGVVIVGAHYDAYGGLTGADDNASGVAVLLELARTMPRQAGTRTVILAAFVNEEPPFFSSRDMGSYQFVKKLLDDHTPVELMLALDLVGYFSDEADSQTFPVPWMGLFYPSRGNFIAVVGDTGSGRWLRTAKRGMRAAGTLPVYSFRGPRMVAGVDWSDHFWFREEGLPGILITDTAMMRNPNYHRPSDRPSTLDYQRMAGVVQGLHGILQTLP